MNDFQKRYCHALVSAGLVSRSFYRKAFEQGYSFEYIYNNASEFSLQILSPRIQWDSIVTVLKDIDIDSAYKKLNTDSIDVLIGDEIPYSLQNIPDPPYWIYVQGNKDILQSVMIGIVGSRKPMIYSKQSAEYIAEGAVALNAVIVSGGAIGIDSIAHQKCLSSGGKTISVLGHGFHVSKKSIYYNILEKSGLLMSEYPPNFPASTYTFPERNRIIAGLSKYICIIQAAEKSGSLITARCALDQGKDVYVIPYSFLYSEFAGSHRLINEGAYVFQSLSFLGNISDQRKIPDFRDDAEKKVWQYIDDNQTFDTLLERTQLTFSFLNNLLTAWEMDGYIIRSSGKFLKN